MQRRGYILQATYRILAGVPIVHIYGRTEADETFLIRHRGMAPSFFVRTADADSAATLGAQRATPTEWRNFDGELVTRIEVSIPADAPPLRERLHHAGIDTFEADVRYAMRYLIDRGVRGGCEIDGSAAAGHGVDLVFDNPSVRPAHVSATPRLLSFDIETNPHRDTLLAISLYGCGADEVLIVDGSDRPMPDRAIRCATEMDAIARFQARVTALDPDVLTGWNVIDFDLTMLAKFARRHGARLALGRDLDTGAEVRIRPAQGYFGSGNANVPGRVVLDGGDLVRGAFIRMEEYSLDAVAQEVLGEGKAVTGDVRDRVGEILYNYRHDLPAFARYARTDARLVVDIIERLDLLALTFARSQLTGMTPDRVAASIASFDFLYLCELRQHRRVAPSVRRLGEGNRQTDSITRQAGGHVLDALPGMHENVWVFDFKSLYPSLIRTFNIDPAGFVADGEPCAETLIEPPGGGRFRAAPGILPGLLSELFPQRQDARQRGDEVASQAIKILMNSFYGVLGTPACRFFNPVIANAITGTGRYLLLWSKDWFESRGYRVLYGDTDSVFIQAGTADVDAARKLGPQLAQSLTADLAGHIGARWQGLDGPLESHLEMEFEKLYRRLFLASVRHGSGGARKRYAGLLDHGDEVTPTVQFVGMEVVRRDWTELAKQVQTGLYERLFSDRPVTEFLADVARELRAGRRNDQLVYRKGLRKSPDEYTANTPPHVVAARKSANTGRVIAYVMTTAGPEPLDALQHPPDLEHYLAKQVRPVAEPVLEALHLRFEQVIGDDRQLSLF